MQGTEPLIGCQTVFLHYAHKIVDDGGRGCATNLRAKSQELRVSRTFNNDSLVHSFSLQLVLR